MFAKPFTLVASMLLFLGACVPAIPAPTATTTPPPSRTPRPTPTPIPLELQEIDTLAENENCMDLEQGLPGERLIEVAYVPSGYCFHGELDLFETGGRVYVAQVTMERFPSSYEAFRIVDVTDAEQPVLVGAWRWNAPTYSADIKAFRQGDRWFLALSRDPAPNPTLCSVVGGVAIIEVTEPAEPVLLRVLTGESTGSRAEWCNSHTAQVGRDADGNGAYLYVSAIDSYNLRVLDIRDLENVTEAGRYRHPDAGFYNERNWFFVHDTTIVGDRVYVANWSAGLIILDREALESGQVVTPLNPLDSIDPWGLQTHQAYPTTDEDFVFVEDEYHKDVPESRLRLYDIRDLQSPKEVAAITIPDSFGAPHNLLVSGDLLFAGWYQDGVRVFQYDTSNPENPTVEPYAFKAVRSSRTTNPYSGPFDGIWGMRLHECEVAGQDRTCVYASDITYGLIILALEP